MATLLAAGAASIGVRCAPDSPWWERARLLYPRRRAAAMTALALPFALMEYASALSSPLSHVGAGVLAVLVGLATYAGGTLAQFRVERAVGPALSLGAWLRGVAFTWLVFWPALAGAIVVLVFLADRPHGAALVPFGVGVACVALFSCGGGIFVARALGLARPASPRLRAIVARAAARRGVPPPVAYEVPWPVVNAIAIRVLRRLAFTERALAVLDDDALAALAAHELRHLEQSRTGDLVVAALVASIPLAAVLPFGRVGPWAAATVALVVTGRVVVPMRRAHEVDADAAATADDGEARTYARALEAGHRANVVPVVMPQRRPLHPHLYDRLLAAGMTPDYPRPAPPARAFGAALVAVLVGVVTPGVLLAGAAYGLLRAPSDAHLMAALALGLGGPRQIERAAGLREERGDAAGALTLYDLAARLEPCATNATWRRVLILADAGRCTEARAAARDLERLVATCRGGGGYRHVANLATARATLRRRAAARRRPPVTPRWDADARLAPM